MEYNTPEFRKWLDKLQQESWQLELLISGFAIYGLFVAIEPIDLKSELAAANGNITYAVIWFVLSIAVYILLFNLVLHVLLRGLWIGAIGLRYVSGDIDYEKLKYSEKFTSFLKRKVGSFDQYIARLENYCSVLFAISFLLIFYVISAILVFAFLSLITISIPKIFEDSSKWFTLIIAILYLFLLLTSLVVFIDFLGQGFLKRKRWTSKIYFPIYRVFSILTLSFLYRPLIYNFLDNNFGKRLSVMLVPIYVVIIFLGSMENRQSNYLINEGKSSEFRSKNYHYEDLSSSEYTFIKTAAIPSKVIEKNHLKVFLVYEESMEDFVFEKNKKLKPEKDTRGSYSKLVSEFYRGMEDAESLNDSTNTDSNNLVDYLNTFNLLYKVKIDTTVFQPNFVVSTNSKERLGFETYLNIKSLSQGKHILAIIGPKKENQFDDKSKTIEKSLVTIPFWYYPQIMSQVPNLPEIKTD